MNFNLTFRSGLLCALILLLTTAACGAAEPLPVVATAVPSPTMPQEWPLGVSFATRAAPTAVVIQITPSPLPPPTATPTPTPIVHTIAEGDTILGLAIQNGTTTDDILTRNPGINPNLLSIGQEVVLPPPATPIFAGEAPTPLPLQVTGTDVVLHAPPSGGLWVLGTVRNEGPHPAENVRVAVGLVGAAGQPLGETAVWVAASIIPAGGTAPFGTLIAQPPTGVEQATLSIVDGRTGPTIGGENDSRYTAVQVQAGTIDEEATAQTQVRGTVVNTGQATAAAVQVIVTLYNAQDRITGYRQIRLGQPLAAGESRPFAAAVAPPGGPAVRAEFYVQALRE